MSTVDVVLQKLSVENIKRMSYCRGRNMEVKWRVKERYQNCPFSSLLSSIPRKISTERMSSYQHIVKIKLKSGRLTAEEMREMGRGEGVYSFYA